MHPNQSRQQKQRGCPVHTVGRGDQRVNERFEKSEGKNLLEKWKPKVHSVQQVEVQNPGVELSQDQKTGGKPLF